MPHETFSEIEKKMKRVRRTPSPEFQQKLWSTLEQQHDQIKGNDSLMDHSSQPAASKPSPKGMWQWVQLHRMAASFLVIFSTATGGVLANEDLRHGVLDWYQPKGSLQIAVEPKDVVVDISLNGELQGQTPLAIDRIEPGTHVIKVTRLGYREFFQEVEVKPEKVSRVVITFGELRPFTDEHETYYLELEPLDSITPREFVEAYFDFLNQGNVVQAYELSPQQVSLESYQRLYVGNEQNFRIVDFTEEGGKYRFSLEENGGVDQWEAELEVTPLGYRFSSLQKTEENLVLSIPIEE